MNKLNVNEVADYFIKKSLEEGKPIDQAKLHALLYYAWGWYTALNDGKKLFDADFRAFESYELLE